MARLHGLNDAALARECLALARRVVALRDDSIEIPHLTYTTALTLQTIPALAKRLDPELSLNDLEARAVEASRRDPVCDIESFEGDVLRAHVASMVSNAMMSYGLSDDRAEAADIRLLSRLLEHGNPVALMVDRITPAPQGLDRVIRPGTGAVLFPAWSPPEPRSPLRGFWLMAEVEGMSARVADHFDDLAAAETAMADVARHGMATDHRLIRRFLGAPVEEGVRVTLQIRNGEDEAIGDALAVIVRGEDAEALLDSDGFSI